MSYSVSIIIPCYNNQSFIENAIASAINQTYNHIEIIVIDDGSTDGSLDIIKAFGDQIRWETGKNCGAPLARNRGIELAKGEYIKFLDADDVLLPDCLETQVSQASKLSPERKAIVYGDAIWVDQHTQPIPSYPLRPRQPDEDNIAHILANSPLTSCPLHKREYLLEIGGFDPSLPRGQEYDLHLRLVLAGVEFLHYPGSLYKYREYVDNARISQRGYSSKGAMFHFQTLQKHHQLIENQTGKPLSLEVRKILAQRFWAFGRGILREGYVKEAQEYFNAARNLDSKNCITGNKPYPWLVKLFGSYWAELLIDKLRQLIPRISS
ncbi:glycosyltransferase [Nodularia harveyana UHCC-0300]|uniref:Glycosyltransferase n=1 Tax=Nodularia harveyana UHCC-0300 TaxID=2974287 RepID=A0ABU5UIM9_9CYAN|nr:glycosyltransferase [Nodularia harveyana]MEA5583324.1 glycosyltransferase [Nodularia harveyana UHCC-0300]